MKADRVTNAVLLIILLLLIANLFAMLKVGPSHAAGTVQYKVVLTSNANNVTDWEKWLNQYGAQGWEWVQGDIVWGDPAQKAFNPNIKPVFYTLFVKK